MFSKEQYKKLYKEANLTGEQMLKLQDILELMIKVVEKKSNLTDKDNGRLAGLNSAFHAITGTLDYFDDEFEK